jgi:hypothetical protein
MRFCSFQVVQQESLQRKEPALSLSLREGCVVLSKGAKLAGRVGSHATCLE